MQKPGPQESGLQESGRQESGKAEWGRQESGPTLIGRFPRAAVPGDERVTGSVEVLAGAAGVRGVVAPQVEVIVVRDGHVVALPGPRDLLGIRLELAPGQRIELPGEAMLRACDAAGGSAAGRLGPGDYELYARVPVSFDDGSIAELLGGPWPLTLG